jgi:glycosyltransferase involved in cell wall biosynthesis
VAERNKIGLIFSNNENWIGGTYYVLNLIQAINTLPDQEKPVLVIFLSKPEDRTLVEETGYPYLQFLSLLIPYRPWERIANSLSRIIRGENFTLKTHSATVAQAVFPYFKADALYNIPRKIFWIPDLQAHYLSHLYTKEELNRLITLHRELAYQSEPVVFSSVDALNSFLLLFPEACCPTPVLHFAVTHPPYQQLDVEQLRVRHQLSLPYFIAPNQFWKHKNQKVVLEAVEQLYGQYPHFQVAFTGKEYDNRAPAYTQELKSWVENRRLGDRIKFLGFIDRKEQLQLMHHSLAVIQPSLFEGWSTVVEDAKAMNQYVLLSDLPVHREQLDYNVLFFNPHDSRQLANCMVQVLQGRFERVEKDYQSSVRQFGLDFNQLMSKQ